MVTETNKVVPSVSPTEYDFVPSKIVAEKEFTYNPNISVTVKNDVEQLTADLRNGEISEDAFRKKIKEFLPNLDSEAFDKRALFGQGDLTIGQIEYVNTLASKEEDRKLHENKMGYINLQVPKGDTVSNTGMGMKDFFLQDDLSRSELFMTRKNKYLNKYPQGAYTMMTLSAYGDEPVELFKKDKDDKEWQFRLPYGRDVGEFGVVSSQVFNARNLGAVIASLVTKNPTGFASFGALVAGDYVGQQVGKTVEQLKGYGEDKFEGEAGVGTLKNYFTNLFSRDFVEAGAVGGSQIFLNRVMNYFTKKDKSLFGLFGMAKGADRYSAAFENLVAQGYNVDPIVHAQLLSWPILRASFFQAKDFVEFPRRIIGSQSTKLYKQFEQFGMDLAGTGDKLSFGKLVQINKELESALGNMMKLSKNPVEITSMNQKILTLAKQWDESSTAIEMQLSRSAGQMAKTEGINFQIGGVKKAATKWRAHFYQTGKGLDFTEKELADAAKNKVLTKLKKNPKKVQIQEGSKSKELNKLLFKLTQLDDTLMRQKGGGNWSETTAQLSSLRKQALALTTHPDNEVRASAKEIFKQIKNSTRKVNGATEEFSVVWNQYNKIMDEHDLVRQTYAMKSAINKSDLDAASFANQFLDPSLPDTSSLLMKIIPEEKLPEIRKAFLSNMTRDPKKMGKMLDDWLENNPEGLKNLLGEPQIKELQALQVIANKFDNSIVNRAINESGEFTPSEFIKFVQQTAEKEGLGSEAALKQMINGFGGIKSAEMDQIRSGIINNILRKATDKGAKDIYDSAGEKALDPAKFFVELEKLSDDKLLSKLFTEDHLKIIKNFDLYTQAISSMEDVGGKIAAAEQRSAVMTSVTEPTKLLGVAKTILNYNIMSRVLGSPIASTKILKLGEPGTEKFILGMRNILADLLGTLYLSPKLLGPEENAQEGIVIDFAPSSVTPGKQSIINKVIESETMDQEDQLDERRNAVTNVVSPNVKTANVIPEGSRLNAIDPRRAAIAFGPNDMLAQPRPQQKTQFAAQGGIMNARKQIQRVA